MEGTKAVLLPITDPKMGKKFEEYSKIESKPKPLLEDERKAIIVALDRVDGE